MSMLSHIHSWLFPPDIGIFHHFQKPPYGGANQFLLALRSELMRQGWRVVSNAIGARTRACILNAFAFDVEKLRKLRRSTCRIVHRVDGPVGTYRGTDHTIDQQVADLNAEFADATVFQSHYSMDANMALGFTFKNPTVIMNAADPTLFHPKGRQPFRRTRKIRLISTSWSSNPNKGAPVYKWLEDHLDWHRYDYTFVGQTPLEFERIRAIPAVPSYKLADLLRQHDIYITASLHDPCSNALIEALACGLPAIYADSGGHPEIVGKAGHGFRNREEIPALLEDMVKAYETHQTNIHIPTLAQVALHYLKVMGILEKDVPTP